MGIKRINEFPEGSGSLSSDDVFLFMDDPSGSGITKKISLSQISIASAPVQTNSGDNRILTSTGTSNGINAENNLTFDGSLLSVSGNLVVNSGTLNSITFNNIDDLNLSARQLAWNSSEGSLALALSNTYDMYLGSELHHRVRNETGAPIIAGTAVYASGVAGGSKRITVAPKTADGSIRETRFMGLVTENIDNGVNGFTTHFGYIRNIDTRGDYVANGATNKIWASGEPVWAEGDILYVHPTAEGKLTKIEPKHSISVAIILNRHQSEGKLFVRPTSYGHLDDNHDVSVSGATNGQFLQYNSATDYWIPSSSGNFTSLSVNNTIVSVSGHTHTTSDITDFNSSVSGLLPTISNSGDNRLLTSTGTSTGINAESNITFDGSGLNMVSASGFILSSLGTPMDGSGTPSSVYGPATRITLVQENYSSGPNLELRYAGPASGVTSSGSGAPRLVLAKSKGSYISPEQLDGNETIGIIRIEASPHLAELNPGRTTARIIVMADGAMGGSNVYQPSRLALEVSSGSGIIDKNLTISSNGAITTNCSLSVDNGVSSPVPIYTLGTVSGNTAISFGIDRQIQKLTLNGTSVNFTEGTGWDITNRSVDVVLEITVSSTTTVAFDSNFITDWYGDLPTFTTGKYLILLRSMGTGVVQGHYIGTKN
jgi:hypothetical protein